MKIEYCDQCGSRVSEPDQLREIAGRRLCLNCCAKDIEVLAPSSKPSRKSSGIKFPAAKPMRKTSATRLPAMNATNSPASVSTPAPAPPPSPLQLTNPVVPPTLPGNPQPQQNLNLYFCETCGKRLTELDLEAGRARNKKLRGIYCEYCANGVNTIEFEAVNDPAWKAIRESHSGKPQPGGSKTKLQALGSGASHPAPHAPHASHAEQRPRHHAPQEKSVGLYVAVSLGVGLALGAVLFATLSPSRTPAKTETISKAENADAQSKIAAVRTSPAQTPPAVQPAPKPLATNETREIKGLASLTAPDVKLVTPAPDTAAARTVVEPAVVTEPPPPAGRAQPQSPEKPAPTAAIPVAPPAVPVDSELSELFKALKSRNKDLSLQIAGRLAEHSTLQPDGKQLLTGSKMIFDQEAARHTALAKLAGQTYSFMTADGLKKGQVVSVDAEMIQMQAVFSIGGQQRTGKAFSVPVASLTDECWEAISPRPLKTPDEKFSRALQLAADDLLDPAKALLETLPASRATAELLKKIEAGRAAVQEKAAISALARMEAQIGGKILKEEARKLRVELESWKKAHVDLAARADVQPRVKELTRAVDMIDLPKTLSLDLGNGVTLDLMLIPPGEFVMGSPNDEAPNWRKGHEGPQRKVAITRPFYMAKYELTRAQWYRIMDPKQPTKDLDMPVSLSRTNAENFCRKLSELLKVQAQLPTEAQWEFACRAGTTTATYGEIDKVAWHAGNADKKLHPVGQKEPNVFGLYDMLGNQYEWVQDWFEKYNAQDVIDPTGPKTGTTGILRGGSYVVAAIGSRAADRYVVGPEENYSNFGCRIVVIPPK